MNTSEVIQSEQGVQKKNQVRRLVVLVFYMGVCATIAASVGTQKISTALWIGLWFAFVASFVLAVAWFVERFFREKEA